MCLRLTTIALHSLLLSCGGPQFIPAATQIYEIDGTELQMTHLGGPCYVGLTSGDFKEKGTYKAAADGTFRPAATFHLGQGEWTCVFDGEVTTIDLPGRNDIKVRATSNHTVVPITNDGKAIVLDLPVGAFDFTPGAAASSNGTARVREIKPRGNTGTIYLLETPLPTNDPVLYDLRGPSGTLCKAELTRLVSIFCRPDGSSLPGSFESDRSSGCTSSDADLKMRGQEIGLKVVPGSTPPGAATAPPPAATPQPGGAASGNEAAAGENRPSDQQP